MNLTLNLKLNLSWINIKFTLKLVSLEIELKVHFTYIICCSSAIAANSEGWVDADFLCETNDDMNVELKFGTKGISHGKNRT